MAFFSQPLDTGDDNKAISTGTPDKVIKPTPALIDSGIARNNSAAIPPERKRHAAHCRFCNPERDTVDAPVSYLTSFNPRIVGLTGTPAYLKKVPTAG